jgi:hypothetical protein
MSLDDDLAAWAATARLTDAEASAIFDGIVGTPAPLRGSVTPGLDPSWWRRYTAGFTARMVSSTRPVRRAA